MADKYDATFPVLSASSSRPRPPRRLADVEPNLNTPDDGFGHYVFQIEVKTLYKEEIGGTRRLIYKYCDAKLKFDKKTKNYIPCKATFYLSFDRAIAAYVIMVEAIKKSTNVAIPLGYTKFQGFGVLFVEKLYPSAHNKPKLLWKMLRSKHICFNNFFTEKFKKIFSAIKAIHDSGNYNGDVKNGVMYRDDGTVVLFNIKSDGFPYDVQEHIKMI